ncbi:hypothetical protein DSO57_1002001 [Entomophthora muscae]|uniref:Uncharacterized protein n=1 Tax=Entomophthora muscae TaxID=34485 RepID=A0ACC2RNU5_9FUNG|nr:hypothetical protein DSO57_1002001 [Entomophthora muscae]
MNFCSSSLIAVNPFLHHFLTLTKDPIYLQQCCRLYQDNHVERICEKIFNLNHSFYPTIPTNFVNQPNCSASKNIYLEKLSELFPDCEATYLREVISSYSHSVIDKATQHLLEKSATYPRRPHFGRLERHDYFKSENYMIGALYRLLNLFPKVPRSTVKAVLAETNYNFVESQERLNSLAQQHSWVNSLLGYLNPRKVYDEPCMYTLELLQDLNLMKTDSTELVDRDLELAKKFNQSQYEEEKQSITCGCCYIQYPFEELAQCDEGHLFCFECVNRYVSEAIHGQIGFKNHTQVPCIDTSGCSACFLDSELGRVLNSDLMSSYNSFIAEQELEKSSLALVRCPFCRYVEVDNDPSFRKIKWINYWGLLISLIVIHSAPVSRSFFWWVSVPTMVLLIGLTGLGMIQLYSLDPVVLFPRFRIPSILRTPVEITTLQCKSPECGKMSCRICFQQCLPSHECMENEKDALRLKVEQAMADAVKRTCPDCNLSFTKLDGCNKMTCRCGYVMCYLCREGIKDISYGHFCEHFRFNPGEPCNQCHKCDLYRDPNDAAAISNAARKAKRAFLQEHPELSKRLGYQRAMTSLSKKQAHLVGKLEEPEAPKDVAKEMISVLGSALVKLFFY